MYRISEKNTLAAYETHREFNVQEDIGYIDPSVLYPAVYGLLADNNQYSFIDSSPSGHTIAVTGTVSHTGLQKKIGGTSLQFLGSGNHAKITGTSAMSTSGDFTVEFWVKMNIADSAGALWDWRRSGNTSSSSNMNIRFNSGGVRIITSADVTFDDGAPLDDRGWHHVAIVRASGTIRCYFDGVVDGTTITSSTSTTVDAATNELTLGAVYSNSDNGDFYIDEIRYSKLAVYTGNFTAPTVALTTTWSAGTNIAANSTASNVQFLMHSDNGGNVGAYGTVQADGHKYYYTDIKGSGPIKDPRIGAHFGGQRHTFNSIQLLDQETAAHGKNVYSIDGRPWCRAVSNATDWFVENGSNGNLINIDSNATGAFIEITGYFNDLNYLGITATDRADDVDITINGDSTSRCDGTTTFDAALTTPLTGRYVDGSSLINLGAKTTLRSSTLNGVMGNTPSINTVKIEYMATGYYVRDAGVELIAHDRTSTATKSQIQIPSQDVTSFGKKFTVSGTPHYNPFGTKGDDSASTIPNNTTGDSVATGWTGSTSAYWDSSLDTATSLGLSAWESGGNFYRPVNGGRVVKWVDSSGNIKTSVNMMPPEAHCIPGGSSIATGSVAATGTHNWSTQYLPQFGNRTLGSNLMAAMTDNGSYPFETRPGGGLNGAWNNTTGYGLAYLSVSFTLGKLYRFRFDASSVSGVASYIGPASNSSGTNWRAKTLITDGTNITGTFRATTNDDMIIMHTGNGAAAFTLANFTLYEIEEPSEQAEIAKTFHWREFGNGSANAGGSAAQDFSHLSSTEEQASYTMDDGLTWMTASKPSEYHNACGLGNSNADAPTSGWIGFIGTGITKTEDVYDVGGFESVPLVQNLPYGSHVLEMKRQSWPDHDYFIDGVQIDYNHGNGTAGYMMEFVFYQPKMPPIPEDAVVIADYMLMADFVEKTDVAFGKISKGARLQSGSRDVHYDKLNLDNRSFNNALYTGGFYATHGSTYTGGTPGEISLPFFGTTIVHAGYNSTVGNDMYIDGVDVAQGGNNTGTTYAFIAPDALHTLGNHNYMVKGVSGVTYAPAISHLEIASPTHTSSHYQPFETLYLHELLGGDRNMEQTNLVVSPYGDTWDEINRDTSYIGNNVLEVGNDTQESSESPMATYNWWRGTMSTPAAGAKKVGYCKNSFTPAYNKIFCLIPGTYIFHVYTMSYTGNQNNNHGSVFVNGERYTTGYTATAGVSHTTTFHYIHLVRGDYIEIYGRWYGSHVYSGFWIEKVS